MNLRPLLLLLVLCLPPQLALGGTDPRPTPPAALDGTELATWIVANGCPDCLLEGKNLSGQQLDGANLGNTALQGVDLTNASCVGCNLAGATFSTTVVDGTDFTGADLRGLGGDCSPYFPYMACQQSADAATTNLSRARLEDADLSGIIDLVVTGAQVEGATFHVAFPPTLTGAVFERVYLSPEYGSNSKKQPFSKAEIQLLAPYITRSAGSWVALGYTFPDDQLPPYRASYDCAKAGNDTERAICASDELAALDRALAAAYKHARATAPDGADAIKQDQRDWLGTRNACGDEWVCLRETIKDRIGVLNRGSSAPVPPRPGHYLPTFGTPRLPTSLTTTGTGDKLTKLMRYDATTIDIAVSADGSLIVDAFALGSNAHMCTIEKQTFRHDPVSGTFLPAGEMAAMDWEQAGRIWLVDEILVFEGGQLWCGARASLMGSYTLDGK